MTATLSDDEIATLDAWWRASNYLAAGMIYLRTNPLLRQPLRPEHLKQRLLGHWGSDPGMTLLYGHLNRLIKQRDLNMIFIAGPGHGAPAVLAPAWLEGGYSEAWPEVSRDEAGMAKLFARFSAPGGIGSHATPETPGSIHEGGELGYSLSHAHGVAFDNPDLIVAAVVGDGEAETGPLATAWHSGKFLNPVRDGAVLPILHLNGYKIANPTLLARIPEDELRSLLVGYGWSPRFVTFTGDESPARIHGTLAAELAECIDAIRAAQAEARKGSAADAKRVQWPMVVLRSPKGWTGPSSLDGHAVAGSWRAHQVPINDFAAHPERLALLETWLHSYRPEELFDAEGRPTPALLALAPEGQRRMSANPVANGGLLRRPLHLPDWRDHALRLSGPGRDRSENTRPLGRLLRDVMAANGNNFRVFGPDETASNKLDALFEVTAKTWLEERLPGDDDGGFLAPDGRVMEMLSEHTLEGWLEGYLLSGRHGFFATYEAFAHVIDSMFNQFAKWLDISRKVPWRAPVSSLNLLLSSTVWRQDHNGFSHQDPGFLDVVTNKSPAVTRLYLPPDANCLLAVVHHCLQSTDTVNVIVADKQSHLQYLSADAAADHVAAGIGIWAWAGREEDARAGNDEPDLVLACCGDVPTLEALAAAEILLTELPPLKLRFVNVVDLFKLAPAEEHSHGLDHTAFDALFTADKPVVFNFHGYPWLIHKLTYRRHRQERIHVRGYKEQGNINTPLELAMQNQIDRFNLVIDCLDRLPQFDGAALRQRMVQSLEEHRTHAHREGVDPEAINRWQWSLARKSS
jgi:xylulose-5-phosphate/fructose-6-phosphate phosphoketolase